jgi:hypothetical protein
MAENGASTSEFRWGAITAAVTALGEPLGLFNTDMFMDDPVLNLIFRGLQLVVIGSIAIAYMFSRTSVKVANGNSDGSIIEAVKRNLDQKR